MRLGVHEQPYLLCIPQFESSAGKDVEAGVDGEKYSGDNFLNENA